MDLYCGQCRALLSDGIYSNKVEVEPCETCLDKAEEEGREKGFKEGEESVTE